MTVCVLVPAVVPEKKFTLLASGPKVKLPALKDGACGARADQQ